MYLVIYSLGTYFLDPRVMISLPTWLYRVTQKSNQLPNYKNSYKIVLKPANEIRFLCQIKVLINRYNIIRS